MKEHNTNFYSLENIKEILKSCEDFLDGEEVYYHIGALRFAYDEIERLNNIFNRLEKAILNTYPCMNLYEQNFKSELLNILKELKEGK